MSIQTTPFYLVPANEPFLRDYDALFTRFAKEDMHTLVLDVTTKMVDTGEIAGVQQLILALQYKPHLIEKMIFALDLRFTEIEGSNLYIPSETWKGDATYLNWFQTFAASPMMLFFLNDEDVRFYTLAGDLLADNLLEIKSGDRKGKQMVGIGGEQLGEVVKRSFNSCWWMLIYCHGSGFDPEPYIQSLLADLGLPLTYEEVYEAYQKDLEKGLNFQTKSEE
jgi:hypothetical protein